MQTTSKLISLIESLPQKKPFLFIDEILEVHETGIIAIKNIRSDEECFQGHFPQTPIFPGVLILESCFQAAAAWMNWQSSDSSHQIGVVTRVDKTKFKNLVRPNDILQIKVQVLEQVPPAVYFKAEVTSHDHFVASTQFACMRSSL